MNPFAWLNPGRWMLYLVLIVALVVGYVAWEDHQREIGRDEVRSEWASAKLAQAAADLAQSEKNAAETARRLAQQKENDDAKVRELAVARAAADRNALDAERLRRQSAAAADLWSHTLRNSPTSAELAAAAETIRVSTDLLGRADRRAGILAAYADTARAAGKLCEMNYDSLHSVQP